MSTIIYHDEMLWADSRAFFGRGYASPGRKTKIWRLKNGDRLGISSPMVGAGEAVRDWFNGDWKYGLGDLPNDYDYLLIKGRDELYVAKSSVTSMSGPIKCKFYAIGSGADFALAAMEMGAMPGHALEIACRFDPLSAPPFDYLDPPE